MKLLELIEKLETIGLYASNEDLMMFDYEGDNGVITFNDDNGVDIISPSRKMSLI